jgi:hypothetical protein
MMRANAVGAIGFHPERVDISDGAGITAPAQILFKPTSGGLLCAKENEIGAELACRFSGHCSRRNKL